MFIIYNPPNFINGDVVKESNVIFSDWDGTLKNTDDDWELGAFNIDLINKLNNARKNGKIVAITTAGGLPEVTMTFVNKLLYGSANEKKEIEEKINKKFGNNPEKIAEFIKHAEAAYELLSPHSGRGMVYHFYLLQKGYPNPEDKHDPWKSRTPINQAKSNIPWGRNKQKSLMDLILQNPGEIEVYGNDLFDQLFVKKLMDEIAIEGIREKEAGRSLDITFELKYGAMKGCDGFEKGPSVAPPPESIVWLERGSVGSMPDLQEVREKTHSGASDSSTKTIIMQRRDTLPFEPKEEGNEVIVNLEEEEKKPVKKHTLHMPSPRSFLPSLSDFIGKGSGNTLKIPQPPKSRADVIKEQKATSSAVIDV